MAQPNQTPEQIARDQIDAMLVQAGWHVQSNAAIDFNTGQGIAVREYQTDVGPADYVLFVDKRAVGVIEAKSESWGGSVTLMRWRSGRLRVRGSHEQTILCPSPLSARGHPAYRLALFPARAELSRRRGSARRTRYRCLLRDVAPMGAQVRPRHAGRIRRRRPQPSGRWHLDVVFIRSGGKIHDLWRAVDDEGEVLDILVQPRRDRKAALELMRRLLKRLRYVPDAIVTDRLRSNGAALRVLRLTNRHVTGGRSNNRAEVSHQPTRRRERQRCGFRSPGSAQRFLATHAAVCNQFSIQRRLISCRTLRQFRADAFAGWREIIAA